MREIVLIAPRSALGAARSISGKGSGGINPEAMAVVTMTMDIDPQGRISGSSPENGCRFRGIAA